MFIFVLAGNQYIQDGRRKKRKTSSSSKLINKDDEVMVNRWQLLTWWLDR